jgi:hypothetical protein
MIPLLWLLQQQVHKVTVLCMQQAGVKVRCEASQLLGGTAIVRRDVTIEVDGRGDSYQCSHYHMLCWPDHEAPGETATVREIMKSVRQVCCSPFT